MTKEDLIKLIDQCCDDIFDRKEPLTNVKERLYQTLVKELDIQTSIRLSNVHDEYLQPELDKYINIKVEHATVKSDGITDIGNKLNK